MLARSVFWAALAVAFLALAVVAWWERKGVRELEHSLGALPHVFIPKPVSWALRRILVVESLGFALAAAAAAFEAFT